MFAIIAVALVSIAATLVGVALWRLTGSFREQKSYRFLKTPDLDSPEFIPTLASLAEAIPTAGCVTQVWTEIDAIQQARLDAIRSARRSVQFETYIMTPGRRSRELSEVLRAKAASGVCVRVLVDDYGTQTLPESYWRQLKNAGVEVRRFNAFDWKSPLSYLDRTHRKLLVIDGHRTLIGGAGISDLWDGRKEDETAWLDIEFQIEGPAVSILSKMFAHHWILTDGEADLTAPTWASDGKPGDRVMLAIAPGTHPTYRDSSILGLMQALVGSVRDRVWISSPYFIPSSSLRRALVAARKRGVDVRVLTMGSRSDKPLVRDAARERYGELLDGDVSIYEFAPSMMHAKMVLADDAWLNFGSANVDPRSLFHNEELNVIVEDRNLVDRVEAFFQSAFDRSQFVSRRSWKGRSLWKRIRGRVGLWFQWQL
ncbi:Cardiolipin synthetase [Geitlerinema sp. FC II]|nr:Cardiolipin synthetase [Geitlerinema sp. FC II]